MPGAPLPKPSTHSERSMNNDGLNHPQSPGSLAGQLEGPPAGDPLIVYRCIDCGKARSIDFHLAHPVRLGEEPNANCCKVCLQRRLSGALQSCPIHGNNLFRPRDKGRYRRHFCAACGVVRSSSYHDTHPIEKDEIPPESYCSGCRSMAVENSGGERTQEPPAKENSTSSESESPTRVRSSTQVGYNFPIHAHKINNKEYRHRPPTNDSRPESKPTTRKNIMTPNVMPLSDARTFAAICQLARGLLPMGMDPARICRTQTVLAVFLRWVHPIRIELNPFQRTPTVSHSSSKENLLLLLWRSVLLILLSELSVAYLKTYRSTTKGTPAAPRAQPQIRSKVW